MAAPVAPTQTATIAAYDNVGEWQGNLAYAQSTDDDDVLLYGTLSAPLNTGDELVLYDNGFRHVASVTGTSWSYNLGMTTYIPDYITVQVENSFTGLAGPATLEYRIIANSVSITNVSDHTGAVSGTVASGGVTDDTTLTLTGMVGAKFGLGTGEKVAIYDGETRLGEAVVTDRSWNYTTSALSDGAHSFTAKIESSSGMAELSSATYNLTTVEHPIDPIQTVIITQVFDNIGVQTGALALGHSTDDTTLALSGTLSAPLNMGDVVFVYDGTTKLGTATVTGTTWTYTTGTLGVGPHDLTARVENAASGLAAPWSLPFTFIENAVSITNVSDDVGTIKGTLASGGTTDDTTPTLTGTLGATLGTGEKVSIYDGVLKLGEATVTGTNWSYTTATAIADGAHNFTAKIESATGTAEIASSSYNITTVAAPIAPTQTVIITAVNDNVGVQQGRLISGQSTDDTTLALSGTLSAPLNTGDAVFVYDGATKLGAAMVTGTIWTYTTDALGFGAHDLTARVENAVSGQAGQYSATFGAVENAVNFVAAYDDAGVVTGNVLSVSNAATDDTTPTLSGTLGAPLGMGEKVAVYDGIQYLGQATVEQMGTSIVWSYDLAGHTQTLTNGMHSLKVVIEDDAGMPVIYSNISSMTVIDSPAAPAGTVTINSVYDDIGNTTGAVTSGGHTDDVHPQISGILDAPLAAGEVVHVYDGVTMLGEATVTGTNWTYTPVTPLAIGDNGLNAKIYNTVSGQAGTVSNTYTITEQPEPPVQTVTIAKAEIWAGPGEPSSTKGIANGTSSQDTTPKLSGTLSAPLTTGEVLAVYDGVTKLGNATVSGADWTYTPATALNYGSHSLTVRVENATTNGQGGMSDPWVVNVVNIPGITFTSDDGTPAGIIHEGNVDIAYISDATPTFSGTLGSTHLGTNEQLAIYYAVMSLGYWTYMDNATVNGDGSWSFTPDQPLDGGYTFYAQIEDATTHVTNIDWNHQIRMHAVIDTTPVTQMPTIDAMSVVNMDEDLESVASGTTAGDSNPVLIGSLDNLLYTAHDEVTSNIQAKRVAVYDTVNGVTTRLGYADVTATEWTYTLGAQGVGDHHYTTRVESADGTLIGSWSSAFDYTVTGTHPTQTVSISQVVDDMGSTKGNIITGQQTDDATPTFGGTLSGLLGTHDVVKVYNDGTELGTATVDGLHWSFTPGSGLTDGTHHITAAVVNTDLATDTGAPSADFAFNLEAAPVALTTMQVLDNAGALTGGISGSTDDTNVSLTGSVTGFETGGKVEIYDGSTHLGDAAIGTTSNNVTNWSYTPSSELALGIHTLKAVFVNPAGAGDTAHQSSLTFNVASGDHTFDAIANTDPVSGMSVKSLTLTGENQILSLEGFTHGEIDVVNLHTTGASGSNTVNISLADVVQNGTNLFNTDSGWAGVDGAGKHQMVVNGNAGDTVKVDSTAQAGSWTYTGTATNGVHEYLIYDNAAAHAQFLVDSHLHHSGAVL